MKTLPIHTACRSGNKPALKKIISAVPRKALEAKDTLGRTPLILCATHNRSDCAEVLIRAGAQVDGSDNAGQTALHVASVKGFHGLVRLLLTHGASWLQGDHLGVTALHLAAVHQSSKCLAAILRCLKPGETDVQDGALRTPLHWGAAYARYENVKLLLAQGANICIPDRDGRTPLHWAAASAEPEALECVRTLLAKEVDLVNWQDYQGRSALHAAVATGTVEVLDFLAGRPGCNVDVLDNAFCTPLHWAAGRGLEEKADVLLRRRASHASADDGGATPLHYAAHGDFAKTAGAFLSRRRPFDEADKLGRSVVLWAVARDAEETVRAVAESNAALLSLTDKDGTSPLAVAAIYGHSRLVDALLDLGVPVDAADRNGMTPFLRACAAGRSKTAQQLLGRGADLRARDCSGSSALHWCAQGGHAYLCQILIKRGAEVDARDALGFTPLHCACAAGDFVNCASVLLEAGGDPLSPDFEGKAPLHVAALAGRRGVARLLCEHGAEVNALFLGRGWMTPLDCALAKDDGEVASVLRKHGGITAVDMQEAAARILQSWCRRLLSRKRKASVAAATATSQCSRDNSSAAQEKADDFRDAQSSYNSNVRRTQTALKPTGIDFIPLDTSASTENANDCRDLLYRFGLRPTQEQNLKPPEAVSPTVTTSPTVSATPDDCTDPKSVPAELRNASVLYHECNGCYHRVRCSHVCLRHRRDTAAAAAEAQHKAACVIQRRFRRFSLKRRFARMRSEAASAFESREGRRAAEEAWQLQLKDFYEQVQRR